MDAARLLVPDRCAPGLGFYVLLLSRLGALRLPDWRLLLRLLPTCAAMPLVSTLARVLSLSWSSLLFPKSDRDAAIAEQIFVGNGVPIVEAHVASLALQRAARQQHPMRRLL